MRTIVRILKFIGRAFERYYPPFFISIFIFGAVATIMRDYGQLGAKESMDSVLQLIGFTFVLATLLLTTNNSAFSYGQQQAISRIGCLFVIAGVCMIFGLGMAAYGLPHQTELLGKVLLYSSSAVYAFAIFAVCFGIAEMGIQATKRLFRTRKPITVTLHSHGNHHGCYEEKLDNHFTAS